ncbi:rubrerythrin family protein, partial [Turicibacter sanguinis]|nr:rubrerythrin family protein [Turicibacter sanguinis]
EGYEQIAAFFTETAGNEKEHAEMWYKLLHDGGLGTTKDNLKIAAFGETGESEDMYPDYAKIAKEEGLPEIAALFEGVAKIENGHSIRYSKLLNNLENNQVFEKKNPVVWECRNCGHRQVGKEAPDYCPVCGYPKSYFQMPCHNY